MPPLRLRPHHLLCALGYRGAGYSDDFTANMTRLVAEGLQAPGGGATEIEITGQADAICAPCPKRRGTGCENQRGIDRLDAAHGARLGIAPGDRLTWAEAQARIVAHVAPGDLAQLCGSCSWRDLGYCEAALKALHHAAGDTPSDG